MAKKDDLLEDDDDATLSDETLLDTDVLDLGEEETDAFELDTAEETVLDAGEEDSGTLLRGSGARVMQMKRKKSHAGMTATLAVSCCTPEKAMYSARRASRTVLPSLRNGQLAGISALTDTTSNGWRYEPFSPPGAKPRSWRVLAR